MGIESISGVMGAASYQSQVTPAAKPEQVSNNTNRDGVVSETSQSAASSQPVVISEVADSNQSNANNNAAENRDKQSAEKNTSMKDVKNVSKLINNNTIAEFSYNEPTNRIAIKIKDKDTDEVIKEIPSEKALEMLAKAWELAGIMVDERR
ncbi:MAG: flagellar protein FlaG [Lachnospira sp.]